MTDETMLTTGKAQYCAELAASPQVVGIGIETLIPLIIDGILKILDKCKSSPTAAAERLSRVCQAHVEKLREHSNAACPLELRPAFKQAGVTGKKMDRGFAAVATFTAHKPVTALAWACKA